MANQVTFQIKIETLGADSVKNVTMDAEELGRVVHEVTDEQEKLNTKLLDINQAQQVIQNICSGFEQLRLLVHGGSCDFLQLFAKIDIKQALLGVFKLYFLNGKVKLLGNEFNENIFINHTSSYLIRIKTINLPIFRFL